MGDTVGSNFLMLSHVALIASPRDRGDPYTIQMLDFSSDVGPVFIPEAVADKASLERFDEGACVGARIAT